MARIRPDISKRKERQERRLYNEYMVANGRPDLTIPEEDGSRYWLIRRILGLNEVAGTSLSLRNISTSPWYLERLRLVEAEAFSGPVVDPNAPEAQSVTLSENAGVFSLGYTYSSPSSTPEAEPWTRWKSITITGTLQIGQTLVALVDPLGTYTYQWYRSDDIQGTNEASIAGATANTYLLVSADEAKFLRVVATDVHGESYSSYYTAAVAEAVVITSAQINDTANTRVLVSTNYDIEATNANGWAVDVNGSAATISSIDQNNRGINTIVLVLSAAVNAGDIVTVSYTNGSGNTQTILSATELPTTTDFPVDNYIGTVFDTRTIINFTNGDAVDCANSAAAWATTTGYVLDDFVIESGIIYKCIEAHTSGTFATDRDTNGYWEYWWVEENSKSFVSDGVELWADLPDSLNQTTGIGYTQVQSFEGHQDEGGAADTAETAYFPAGSFARLMVVDDGNLPNQNEVYFKTTDNIFKITGLAEGQIVRIRPAYYNHANGKEAQLPAWRYTFGANQVTHVRNGDTAGTEQPYSDIVLVAKADANGEVQVECGMRPRGSFQSYGMAGIIVEYDFSAMQKGLGWNIGLQPEGISAPFSVGTEWYNEGSGGNSELPAGNVPEYISDIPVFADFDQANTEKLRIPDDGGNHTTNWELWYEVKHPEGTFTTERIESRSNSHYTWFDATGSALKYGSSTTLATGLSVNTWYRVRIYGNDTSSTVEVRDQFGLIVQAETTVTISTSVWVGALHLASDINSTIWGDVAVRHVFTKQGSTAAHLQAKMWDWMNRKTNDYAEIDAIFDYAYPVTELSLSNSNSQDLAPVQDGQAIRRFINTKAGIDANTNMDYNGATENYPDEAPRNGSDFVYAMPHFRRIAGHLPFMRVFNSLNYQYQSGTSVTTIGLPRTVFFIERHNHAVGFEPYFNTLRLRGGSGFDHYEWRENGTVEQTAATGVAAAEQFHYFELQRYTTSTDSFLLVDGSQFGAAAQFTTANNRTQMIAGYFGHLADSEVYGVWWLNGILTGKQRKDLDKALTRLGINFGGPPTIPCITDIQYDYNGGDADIIELSSYTLRNGATLEGAEYRWIINTDGLDTRRLIPDASGVLGPAEVPQIKRSLYPFHFENSFGASNGALYCEIKLANGYTEWWRGPAKTDNNANTGDTTKCVYLTAVTINTGNQVVLTFSGNITDNSYATAPWYVRGRDSSGVHSVTGVAVSTNTITLTLGSNLVAGDGTNIDVRYTKPGANPVVDTNAKEIESFNAFMHSTNIITNNLV